MKVLFPLDGTDLSLRALEKGLSLLKGASGSLRATAYYAREQGGENLFEATARELAGGEPNILGAEDALARAKEIATGFDVPLDAKVAPGGSPHEAVLKEAGAYDLLVVHALTKPSVKDLFTGSAIEKLVRNAPTSVLVVRD